MELPGRDIEKNNESVFHETQPVFRCKDDSAARCHHQVAFSRHIFYYLTFPATKSELSLNLKDRRDADAGPRNNLVIGINKLPAKAARKHSANGGFSGPHEADEIDILRIVEHG